LHRLDRGMCFPVASPVMPGLLGHTWPLHTTHRGGQTSFPHRGGAGTLSAQPAPRGEGILEGRARRPAVQAIMAVPPFEPGRGIGPQARRAIAPTYQARGVFDSTPGDSAPCDPRRMRGARGAWGSFTASPGTMPLATRAHRHLRATRIQWATNHLNTRPRSRVRLQVATRRGRPYDPTA
jgi:hypothetical protein